MNHCTGWFLPALRQRFDELDSWVQKDMQIRHDREQAEKCLEQLKASITSNQRDLFNEWDDLTQKCIAREKEALYRFGMMDGFQLNADMFPIQHSQK